jgi:hypothetical protein
MESPVCDSLSATGQYGRQPDSTLIATPLQDKRRLSLPPQNVARTNCFNGGKENVDEERKTSMSAGIKMVLPHIW